MPSRSTRQTKPCRPEKKASKLPLAPSRDQSHLSSKSPSERRCPASYEKIKKGTVNRRLAKSFCSLFPPHSHTLSSFRLLLFQLCCYFLPLCPFAATFHVCYHLFLSQLKGEKHSGSVRVEIIVFPVFRVLLEAARHERSERQFFDNVRDIGEDAPERKVSQRSVLGKKGTLKRRQREARAVGSRQRANCACCTLRPR